MPFSPREAINRSALAYIYICIYSEREKIRQHCIGVVARDFREDFLSHRSRKSFRANYRRRMRRRDAADAHMCVYARARAHSTGLSKCVYMSVYITHERYIRLQKTIVCYGSQIYDFRTNITHLSWQL